MVRLRNAAATTRPRSGAAAAPAAAAAAAALGAMAGWPWRVDRYGRMAWCVGGLWCTRVPGGLCLGPRLGCAFHLCSTAARSALCCGPRARPRALAVAICCVMAWEMVARGRVAAVGAWWAVAALLAFASGHADAQCAARSSLAKFCMRAAYCGRAGSSAVQYSGSTIFDMACSMEKTMGWVASARAG